MLADRRTLIALAAGHACADFCQGAVPALVPFLVHRRGLSFSDTGLLLLVMSFTSSLLQPAIGAWADRREANWMIPAGVAIGGAGIASVGFLHTLPPMLAAVAVAGLGIALFHPAGARRATQAAGDRPGSGLGIFAMVGSAGFTLAPALLTPSILLFGLRGTLIALPPTLVVATLLQKGGGPGPHPSSPLGGRARPSAVSLGSDRPRAFALLATVASLRAGTYFGLQGFLAAMLIDRLGVSTGTGNAALTVMLAAGAVGTLIGGRLADRYGNRFVLTGALAATPATIVLLQLAPSPAAAIPAAALCGLTVVGGYTSTVVLGQRLLPHHQTLAAGMTLGFAMGAGGITVAALGPLADGAGPAAALWVCAGLAAGGALLAHLLDAPERVASKLSFT
ncbi:MAG: transporter, family, fosmidomycin resistance protein [Solirubrobacteraceae bacterium]|nr:transporter, family, fosmidomycin resistance protein [Solirubrobacteraceae bacterium]